MTDKRVTVLALVKARAGHEDRVREELLALVAPTRAEAGCLGYDLHQNASDPTVFMFYETWESRAALDAHSRSPHLEAFDERAGDSLDGPVEITYWEKLS